MAKLASLELQKGRHKAGKSHHPSQNNGPDLVMPSSGPFFQRQPFRASIFKHVIAESARPFFERYRYLDGVVARMHVSIRSALQPCAPTSQGLFARLRCRDACIPKAFFDISRPNLRNANTSKLGKCLH